MRLGKYWTLFATVSFISINISADTEIRIGQVSGLAGPQVAYAGDTIRIPIEYVNRDPYRYNVASAFRVYSRQSLNNGDYGTGTATWVSTPIPPHGYFTYWSIWARPNLGPQVDMIGGLSKTDFGGILAFWCFGCDGRIVDTLGFAAAANDTSQKAIPPMDSGLMFTIVLTTQRNGDSGNVICIDSSSNFPPTNTWRWPPFNSPQGTPTEYPTWAGPWCFEVLPSEPTAINQPEANELPLDFEVFQNYPNPFNPSTNITFALPQASSVQVVIYNVIGARVAVLFDGRKSAGEHTIVWNGRDSQGNAVPTGVYFYRITAGSIVDTKKMVLVR